MDTTKQTLNLSAFTSAVIAEVKQRIGTEQKFRGVCVDTILDSYRQGLSIDAAANIAEDDTVFWDGIYLRKTMNP